MIQLGAIGNFIPKYNTIEVEESDIALLINQVEDFEDSVSEIYGGGLLTSLDWILLTESERKLLGCLCALAKLQHFGFVYRLRTERN